MAEVTFRSNSRVMGYQPGDIITTELTPIIKALLHRGRHLTLIDPPTLDEPEPDTAETPTLPFNFGVESGPSSDLPETTTSSVSTSRETGSGEESEKRRSRTKNNSGSGD